MKHDKQIQIAGQGVFTYPRYVTRQTQADGWQVRPPNKPSRFFSDGEHGAELSLQAAMDYLRQCGEPIVGTGRKLADLEQPGKKTPVGVAGIFFVCRMRDHCLEFYFRVTAGKLEGEPLLKNVYIGTLATWRQNYEAKFREAMEVRQHLVRLKEAGQQFIERDL